MKSLIFILLIFISFATRGQEILENLPRRVSKSVEKTFGKEDYQLESLTTDKSENFASTYEGNFYRLKQTAKDEPSGYLHIGRVKTCRTGGCGAPGTDTEQNSSEYFDYVILFDTATNVELVKIFNYQATTDTKLLPADGSNNFLDSVDVIHWKLEKILTPFPEPPSRCTPLPAMCSTKQKNLKS
jgi:hypothetical protein